MDIKLYDTVKDKNGKRYRVTETKNDGTGHIIATLKGINPDGSARRGMPRKVGIEALKRDYTRVNLAPVEVKKIDDLREEETKVTQVPTPSEKALEMQKQAVRELSEKEVEEALTKSTYGGVREEDAPSDGQTLESVQKENERLREENFELVNRIYGEDQLRKDMEILKTECLDLKEENRRLKESNELTNGQLRVRERELDEAKKTISKMKYAHEEEVRALEDELTELKILAKKGNEYSDRLADNEETFRKMRAFSKSIVGMADSIMGLAYLIEDETEGRI